MDMDAPAPLEVLAPGSSAAAVDGLPPPPCGQGA
jgi:hypothetical protein